MVVSHHAVRILSEAYEVKNHPPTTSPDLPSIRVGPLQKWLFGDCIMDQHSDFTMIWQSVICFYCCFLLLPSLPPPPLFPSLSSFPLYRLPSPSSLPPSPSISFPLLPPPLSPSLTFSRSFLSFCLFLFLS